MINPIAPPPLVRLEVENFRSLREVVIDFPDGLIGIVGRNGRGKTSLLRSISFAYWGMGGVPSKWRKERLITRDADTMRVELSFTVAGRLYVVERKLSRKGLVIEASLRSADDLDEAGRPKVITGNDIVTSEVIRLIGPYDKQSISRFVSQKEVNALTMLDPAPRKRLILGLLGVEGVEGAIKSLRDQVTEYDRTIKARKAVLPDVLTLNADRAAAVAWREQVADDRVTLAGELVGAQRAASFAESELARIERIAEAVAASATTLEMRDEQLADLDNEDGRISAREIEIAAAGGRLVELDRTLADIESHRDELGEAERVAALMRQAPELREQQQKLEARIKTDRATVERLDRLAHSEAGLAREEKKLDAELRALGVTHATASGERGELRGELQRIIRELDAINAQMAAIGVEAIGACPTCGQSIADEGAFREHLAVRRTELEMQKADITTRGIAAKTASEQAEARRTEAESRIDALRIELEVARNAARDLGMARGELTSYETQYGQNTADLAALDELGYDEARHTKLAAEADALPGLIELRGQLRETVAEAERLAGDRARVAEKRTIVQESRAAAAAAAAAAGYDRDAHLASKASLETTRSVVHALEVRAAELEGLAGRAADALARADEDLAKHGALVGEIDLILADRSLVDLTRQTMERFKIDLIGRIRPALSRKASELLREMTDGEYADLVLDEDYGISIGNGPLLWDPGEPSGGEDDLANLCLRLAISELISESSGSGPSFVVLDEVLGSQDEERRELVMAALPRLAGHFRQVLMVAHVPGVQDRFPVVIDAQWDQVSRTSRFIFPPAIEANA